MFRRQPALFGGHSLNHNIGVALETLDAIGPKAVGAITNRLTAEEVAAVMAGRKPPGSLKIQIISQPP